MTKNNEFGIWIALTIMFWALTDSGWYGIAAASLVLVGAYGIKALRHYRVMRDLEMRRRAR